VRPLDDVRGSHSVMLEVDHGTQRLDRSQESFALNEALFAGVAKSRFSTIRQWIKPHTVVGTIIFLATLLYLVRLFGSVFLQKRSPDPTTDRVLYALVAPFAFWYAVRLNLDFLVRTWESAWGKLAYSILLPATVIFCKVIADQQIRLLTQSNPSLFPSSQQAITALTVIVIILSFICSAMIVPLLWQQIKFSVQAQWEFLLSMFRVREVLDLPRKPSTFRSFPSKLTRVAAPLWISAFIMVDIMPFFDTGFAEFGGKRFNPAEVLLLWTSFIPNDLGLAGLDRICTNLPPGTFVSPFDERTPVPNEVLKAEQIPAGPDSSGRSYTYRVVPCLKSTPSGPPDTGSSTATGAVAPNGRAPAADTAAPPGPRINKPDVPPAPLHTPSRR